MVTVEPTTISFCGAFGPGYLPATTYQLPCSFSSSFLVMPSTSTDGFSPAGFSRIWTTWLTLVPVDDVTVKFMRPLRAARTFHVATATGWSALAGGLATGTVALPS